MTKTKQLKDRLGHVQRMTTTAYLDWAAAMRISLVQLLNNPKLACAFRTMKNGKCIIDGIISWERGSKSIHFSGGIPKSTTSELLTLATQSETAEWKIEFGANTNAEESIGEARERRWKVVFEWLHKRAFRAQQFEAILSDFTWIWDGLLLAYGKPEVIPI